MASTDSLPQIEAVATDDGSTLGVRFFGPEQGPPKGAVLIVPAMGVGQGFYAPFARWLAREGYLAATFDFRGVGASQHGSLRDTKADIFDWARDCGAVLEALRARAIGDAAALAVSQGTGAPAPTPITWIGHSLGGQIVPFVPGRERIGKIMTVATGSGYWRENSEPLRRKVWWFWFVIVPLATKLFGYFPGKRLRTVGDLPRGVIEQWRRWCLSPEYAVGVEASARAAYAAVTTPIVSLSFTDDEMMSAENTASIHGFYAAAPRTMKRLEPAAIGVPRIGHFGFFRKQFEDTLWRTHVLPELS